MNNVVLVFEKLDIFSIKQQEYGREGCVSTLNWKKPFLKIIVAAQGGGGGSRHAAPAYPTEIPKFEKNIFLKIIDILYFQNHSLHISQILPLE